MDGIGCFFQKKLYICSGKKTVGMMNNADVFEALIDQPDNEHARNYWKVLKHRLKKEGNETVTNCNQLKLRAADGKMRSTDVADTEQLFRLIQSIPSPKSLIMKTKNMTAQQL